MTDAPDTIYLQWENPEPFKGQITWDRERIYKGDVRYRRDEWRPPEAAPAGAQVLAVLKSPSTGTLFQRNIYTSGSQWKHVIAWQPLPALPEEN